MPTIPASEIVTVTPSVVGAGGTALELNGLLLSTSTRVPWGLVYSFPTADSISSYFGPSSAEAALGAIYFNGYDNSLSKPGALLITQYNTAAVGAYLRSGNMSVLTLAQLQALTPGVLTITVNGTAKTSSTITLTGVASFSAAAALIQAAFTTPGFTVTYDSVSGAFIFNNTTTGASSTLTYATGTMSTSLKLTSASGAVLSPGADASTPAAFMGNVIIQTQNWASFTTAFDPDAGAGNTLKLQFAAWASSRLNRFLYVAWDTDTAPTLSNAATSSLGYLLKQTGISGIMPLFAPTAEKAVFVMGAVASLDFARTNGRATMAFRSQAGLTADVNQALAANNLIANNYNFYGVYATANDQFVFLYPGSVTGAFKWADSYVNQIWLNNALQLALMTLLTQIGTIPYNAAGYGKIESACADPIQAALNFGAIRAGVPLSAQQASQVNALAGVEVDTVLSTRGYYLQIQPATAIVRAARASPPVMLFYMDGQSVQRISLSSIAVQ
jgi:hypothetical protein